MNTSPSPFPHIAYIALGSNLGDPLSQVLQGTALLDQHPDMRVSQVSSWYSNPALTLADDHAEHEDYVNGVIQLHTALSPLTLLDALQAIELQQGRQRSEKRWQARTLDLDILLYDQASIKLPRLTIPHSQMSQRAFVLYPLYEIAPDLILPDGRPLQQLLSQVSDKALEKIVISS